MINLDFHYASAQNFLCFGPEGIEINFKNYGNVVLIQGFNYDDVDDKGSPSSNGTGKSAIADVIAYTIYGKTVKKPKKLSHAVIMNNKTDKGLRTELIFDKYRIVRQRKPDKLDFWISEDHIWDNDTKVSTGSMPNTQKEIEREIGISYETFVNVVVFDDTNAYSFLESDTPTKRAIVENLLSLERYRTYGQVATDKKKEVEANKSLLLKEYERLIIEEDVITSRVAQVDQQEKQWKVKRQEEIKLLIIEFKKKQELLTSLDKNGEIVRYNEAQDKIRELNSKVVELDKQKTSIKTKIVFATDKIAETKGEIGKIDDVTVIKNRIKIAEEAIRGEEARINDIKSLVPGIKCRQCYGMVNPDNADSALKDAYLIIDDREREILAETNSMHVRLAKIAEMRQAVEVGEKAVLTSEARISSIVREEKSIRDSILELSKIKKPETDLQQSILEEQITELRKQINKKKVELDEVSPYEEIKASVLKDYEDKKQECSSKKKEIDSVDKVLPYYNFWVKAFGDKGIRKFVIDGIVPALNSKIAYWLQYLIDGKIKLSFNNQLEENIDRVPYDGNPFVYFAMSGGERQRLNLAVSQSFAHIMMLNSGMCPSLVFLDEVTTNIDQNGVVGIYNMIFELAKERQVFVTTHDRNLLEMLGGCETLCLEKRNGLTKIIT